MPLLKEWNFPKSKACDILVARSQVYPTTIYEDDFVVTYISYKNQLNVGKCTIHGSYGKWSDATAPKNVFLISVDNEDSATGFSPLTTKQNPQERLTKRGFLREKIPEFAFEFGGIFCCPEAVSF